MKKLLAVLITPFLVAVAIAMIVTSFVLAKHHDTEREQQMIEVVQQAASAQEMVRERYGKYSSSDLDLYELNDPLRQMVEDFGGELLVETGITADSYSVRFVWADGFFEQERDQEGHIYRSCDSEQLCQDGSWGE